MIKQVKNKRAKVKNQKKTKKTKSGKKTMENKANYNYDDDDDNFVLKGVKKYISKASSFIISFIH